MIRASFIVLKAWNCVRSGKAHATDQIVHGISGLCATSKWLTAHAWHLHSASDLGMIRPLNLSPDQAPGRPAGSGNTRPHRPGLRSLDTEPGQRMKFPSESRGLRGSVFSANVIPAGHSASAVLGLHRTGSVQVAIVTESHMGAFVAAVPPCAQPARLLAAAISAREMPR